MWLWLRVPVFGMASRNTKGFGFRLVSGWGGQVQEGMVREFAFRTLVEEYSCGGLLVSLDGCWQRHKNSAHGLGCFALNLHPNPSLL